MRIPVLRSLILLAIIAGLSLFVWMPVATAHGGEGMEITAQYSSLERTVIHVQIHDYARETVYVDGHAYTRIGLEGEGIVQRRRPGFPNLPAIYRSLMIPDTAKMQVNILNRSFHDVEGIDVISHKGTILRNVDPASVPYTFNDVYETDAWYPGDISMNRDPYIMRNVRGMVIEIFPFQYNPVQRTLRVYDELEIEVVATHETGTNVLLRDAGAYKPDRSFFEMQQRQFINSANNRTEPPDEDGDMLIIAPASFMTTLQPLVDWKNATGISTTTVDVATIGNNSTAIKNYITNVYNQGNLAFVLLVGDSTDVVSGSANGGLSDAFYSTMTGDWYPDLFVGRFSASTTAQVQTQVERTVAYEQEGHNISMGGWNASALGVASDQGSGTGHYGEADYVHMNLIRDELLAYGFNTVDQIYDPSGTASQVAASLNAGRRLVNYCGHGSTTSWGSTGFSNTNVNNLTNVGKLPFIFSVACVNGAFGSGTCFAEAWLRATSGGEPSGAVACYMSTVNQSWAPPMYAEGNHSNSGKYGAAERFWMEMHSTLGGNWYGGSCCMMDLAGSSGYAEFMNWVIFGDPSLRLREATPPTMTVKFPDGLPSGLYPPGPEMPITIEIVSGSETYVPGSGYLHYRFDSGSAFTPIAVTDLGNDLYEAVIPNTSPGDEPEFYVTADTDGGNTIMMPANAPAETYGFDVGFIELLMQDDFETATGWTVQSTNLSTGEWERGDPQGTDAQPENDHTASGTQCYVTGRTGSSSGDNDVDGGPTYLFSPVIDLSSGDATISYYYYFYHSDYGTQQPMQVHVTNNGTTWVKVADISHSPNWTEASFLVSDYVAPTATVQVRFMANDNPNDDIVEALIDDFRVDRFVTDPALWADDYDVSVAVGAQIGFTLDAEAANSGRKYLLLASFSGTSPGYTLPGGAVLPLNWDVMTDLVVANLGTPVFQDFVGTLDGTGTATATLNSFGPLDGSLVGNTAHFAFLLGNPFEFTSNAIPVRFLP